MNVSGATLFNKTTLSGTTKVISPAFPLAQVALFAYQYSPLGSSILGSLQLFVSCDEDTSEDGRNVVNWAALGSAITPTTTTSVAVNVPDVGYRWLKAEFTPASGNGTLTLTVSAKG